MNTNTQVMNLWNSPLSLRLVLLSLFFIWAAGCAPQTTEPAAPPAPTLPSGWEAYTGEAENGQCRFSIGHPADMELTSQGHYSWIGNRTSTEPSGPIPNFLYVSVIPDGFQGGEDGSIYNYQPAETQTLLNTAVGQSRSLREDPTLAPWFTFTRLPDTTLSHQAAQTYENTQPWEFPPGTKEIRYYLQANGCTYMVGGYMATVGSGEPLAIGEELFHQIIATFQVNP